MRSSRPGCRGKTMRCATRSPSSSRRCWPAQQTCSSSARPSFGTKSDLCATITMSETPQHNAKERAMDSAPDRDPAREVALRSALGTRRIGRMVYAYGVVASTMDLAHRLAAADSPEGTLISAAEQLGGRGRQGRRWVSAPGGLYCSVILRPQVPLEQTPQLALVAGLAAAGAIP